jgi:hypothetical protein
MPLCRSALGVALCLLVWASSASAIVIKTSKGPVGGFLVSEDGKYMTLRVTEDGQEVERDYLIAKNPVLYRIEVERLKSLSRDKPKAYSDFADELAKEEQDPEARYMARRLYLITAHLDRGKLGKDALLKLSALADSEAEARRCRALAYLLDEKADATLLAREEVRTDKASKLPAEGLKDFLKALQAYRAGKVVPALELAGRKGMERIFSQAPGDLDQAAFKRMCTDVRCAACKMKGTLPCSNCSGKGLVKNMFGGLEVCTTCNRKKSVTCDTCGGRGINQDLSSDTLRVILRAELWATEQLLGGGPAGEKKPAPGEALKWSSALQKRQVSPVLPLSLETLIPEIDPRKCKYHNKTWVIPSE